MTNNLGVVHSHLADYPAALIWYRRCLEARQQIKDKKGEGRVTSNIGIVYSALGSHERAEEAFKRAIELTKVSKDDVGHAQSLSYLGNLYLRMNQPDQARPILEQAFQDCKDLGLVREWVSTAASLVTLLDREERWQDIPSLVNESLTAAKESGLRRESIVLEYGLWSAKARLNDDAEAVPNLQRLEKEAVERGLASEQLDINGLLYRLAKEEGDFEAALDYHEQVSELRELIAGEQRQRQLALFEAEQSITEERLRAEERERLVYNMLPPPIADRILLGETNIADNYTNASVMFADIVGFTPYAASMKVEELIAYLNSLFSRFDEISAKHGLTKVKTIGDAYLAVAGAPVELSPEECVIRMASAALDMIDVMSDGVQLRIGVHIGRIAAGVIGTERVVWDIWGDTVNVAARMEQHGSGNRVHASKSFASALENAISLPDAYDPHIRTEDRGIIPIKGKGDMHTFWITRVSK